MDLGFQPNQLFEYFNNLLPNSSDVENREIVNYPSEIDQSTLLDMSNELNCPIKFEEVKQMICNLKNEKTPGLDMISAELLKNLNTKFFVIFVWLFNRILESGDFPEEWAIEIIVLLFKGG